MQVKRYFAPNMRLALKMVREEVGPDAVILSSKRVDNGVEILTSTELQDEPPTSAAAVRAANDNPFKAEEKKVVSSKPSRLELELEQMQTETQRRARELADNFAKKQEQFREQISQQSPAVQTESASAQPELTADVVQLSSRSQEPSAGDRKPSATDREPSAADVAKAVVEQEMTKLRMELQSMRDMLEQQLSSAAWGNYRQQHPQQASLWRRMKRMGLSARLVHELLEHTPKTVGNNDNAVWQSLMAKLAQRIPVVGGDLIAGGGVFVLVGPTGAGKTTTIGKLATRYVLEHGAEQVALVTMDTARIAAFEQLRTFGRILNVPIKVVDKNHSLEQILLSLRHKKLVLVDTAGFSREDTRLQQQLTAINSMDRRVKTLLTLPATSQKPVIKAAYQAFKSDNLAGCILTKLDEAVSIGEVLSLVIEKSLPVAYTSSGQGIPEDISVADRQELIRRAITLARLVTADESAMVDEVVSLAAG